MCLWTRLIPFLLAGVATSHQHMVGLVCSRNAPMSGFGLIGVCLSKKASDEQPREAPFHKKGPLSLLFWGSG